MDNKEKSTQDQVQARRDQIIGAAAEVFAEKGYERATVKEVAARAEIAPGTIYLYFKNKHDLLLAIADRLIGQALIQTQDQITRIDADEYIAAIQRNTLLFVRQNRSLLQALITEVWTDDMLQEQLFAQILTPVFRAGIQILDSQIEQGNARPCQTEIVVATIAGSLVVLSVLRALAPESFLAEFSDDEVVEELSRLFASGLKIDSQEEAV